MYSDILQVVKDLQAEAEAKGMDIDWETARCVPNKFAGLDHHQRAALADNIERAAYFKEYYDYDNNPASPEQAWA
jgi:hypothetical protein